jgi:hypothetical protein
VTRLTQIGDWSHSQPERPFAQIKVGHPRTKSKSKAADRSVRPTCMGIHDEHVLLGRDTHSVEAGYDALKADLGGTQMDSNQRLI